MHNYTGIRFTSGASILWVNGEWVPLFGGGVDNTTLNTGTGGDVIATDDIAGVKYQRVKVNWGADGATNDVTASAGLPTDPLDRAARDLGKVDIAMGQGAHDAVGTAVDPVCIGGFSSVAAPIGVSTDGDLVKAWFLANGAQAAVITAAGALIGGDATNGLDVDVTRVQGSVTVDSELPAAAALADAATNPTTPMVGAGALLFNGTTWDRMRGDITNGLDVDVTRVGGNVTVTNAGTFATQVDGAALIALQKIDDPVIVDNATFTPATSSVMVAGFEADETATASVGEGTGGAARMTLDRKQIVTVQPHTTGGLSIFRSLDLDETEEDVKTTAGQVYGMWVTNTATTTRFVKFYNATAATVVVGTTTPVITIGIPGNSSDDIAGLFSSTNGITFDTAICVAATTGVADADVGAPGINDVVINIFYK